MEGHEQSGHLGNDLAPLLPIQKHFHLVALRGPTGERRFPVDLIRDEIRPLSTPAWLAFQGDELGDPPAYAADLMRRLTPMRRNWIAQASLRFVEKPTLIELARQSHCRGLIFSGELISHHYLTTETTATPEKLSQLAQMLRRLAENGVFSIIRFTFGYDTDDESVFERTARFCMDARIGLPLFSILTPQPGTPLFTALDRAGRILHTDLSRYGGSHAVFCPKLITPEALENGLYWTRQQVYSPGSIWQRTFSWTGYSLQHLFTNYQQHRLFAQDPRGVYTEVMRLLRQLAQPIPVQEQESFISTLKDAVGEKKRKLQGALLRVGAIRNEHLHALTLRLEGVLDTSSATEVLRRIHEAIRAGHQKIVLDLKGLELVSQTVMTRFLEENAATLAALHGHVVFRHLRGVLDAIKANLGGVLPNAELFDLVTEEA
ncbi:MAG: STAS domain-containing protein [Candidatus Binatia bacterium]